MFITSFGEQNITYKCCSNFLIHLLESIQNEINDLIKLSDGIGVSRNPLIRVHESTKFEIESIIARCITHKDDIYES